MFAALPLHDPDGDPLLIYVNQIIAIGHSRDPTAGALVRTSDGRAFQVKETFDLIYYMATGKTYKPETFQPPAPIEEQPE